MHLGRRLHLERLSYAPQTSLGYGHIQYTHAKNIVTLLTMLRMNQFLCLKNAVNSYFYWAADHMNSNADISYVTKDQRLRHYAF